ncbi:MAG TPA: serpin family protein [Sedimentisphaerales bacterium]|nr:serpin family protein [Sedimentisphaerales bacterium]
MKTIKNSFILLAAMTLVTSAFAFEEPPAKEDRERQAIVRGNNRFVLELYAKLRDKEGNLFCSPYSISTAVAMVCAGARGQTEQQIAEAMHFPIAPAADPAPPSNLLPRREQFHRRFRDVMDSLNSRTEKGAYELHVANALWGQRGCRFYKEYIELVETNYHGRLTEVDFITAAERARETINTWVEKQTKEKIKNLIPPGALDRLTRLVLTNAIYFKGSWASRFEKEGTRQAPFTLTGGDKVNVLMMNQTETFNYMQAEDFQVLEMPYVENELSMLIFLPKQFDGLNEFERALSFENLSEWLMKLRKTKVIASIPRFKITSEFALTDVLKSMGIKDAFSDKADFSAMTGMKDLYISAVLHKAYVDVTEEGTEAAAATGIVVGITSVQPPPPTFRADHPFLFLIRDNLTGSILFIGRVMNPAAAS